MFNIDFSKYAHSDHPRVRRIANRLAQLVSPYVVDGKIPTKGYVPDSIVDESNRLFDELETLQSVNKRGN